MRLRSLLPLGTVILLACCVWQRPVPPSGGVPAEPPAATPPAPRALPPAATGVVEGKVPSADGVPIHYRADGTGGTALVFVHGWSCDGGIWKNQVPFFTSAYRVVTLDLAGHGASGSGRANWTVEAYAEDVKAVVQKLGLEKVVLIGHSMSGPITVEAARRMPGRVVALVPVDTLQDLSENPDPDAWAGIIQRMREDFRSATTEFVHALFPERADPALVNKVASAMAAVPPNIAIETLLSVSRYDVRPALAQLRVPIRCINGDKWPTEVERSRTVYPRYDAVILPGLGHFPMLEAPKEFNERLREVVREVAG
ncbi:MAG: alpha/beta hydrolase [Acidobacteriia bacterium]|nr:alpha/beta hydrolase [Terriglobia bacterium]